MLHNSRRPHAQSLTNELDHNVPVSFFNVRFCNEPVFPADSKSAVSSFLKSSYDTSVISVYCVLKTPRLWEEVPLSNHTQVPEAFGRLLKLPQNTPGPVGVWKLLITVTPFAPLRAKQTGLSSEGLQLMALSRSFSERPVLRHHKQQWEVLKVSWA